MKAINVALSLLVSLSLFVFAFEGGLRLMGKGPNAKINRPDSVLGWSKRPNFEFARRSKEFDVVLRTNALGLRDDAMDSPAKPEGTRRVVCLGDSFVLGYTVDRADLFVDQLESWWKAEGRAVDVINTGTEGYSTDQEVAWLQQNGQAFAPDVVLLFAYENDLYWNGQADYVGTPKPRFTAAGEREDPLLPEPCMLCDSAIGRLFQGAPKPSFVTPPTGAKGQILVDFSVLLNQAPPELGDALERTQGALAALKSQCATLGARLVVVPIPSHSAISSQYREEVFGPRFMGDLPSSAWSPDRPVDFVLASCAELGIQTLDPRPALKAAPGQEALYNQTDFHLTPAGNRVLTAFLKPELDRLQLLPMPARGQELAQAPPALPAEHAPARWPYVFGTLWLILGAAYALSYRSTENPLLGALKVGLMLGAIFAIVLGGKSLLGLIPASVSQLLLLVFVFGIVGFIVYKMGRRVGTMLELVSAFVRRGHWYLMPLVVILLTIGSLLVVAASSPLVAPFIYTLF